MKLILKIFVLLVFFAKASFAQYSDSNKERILNFSSDIVVNKDSTITVTENIKVFAGGDQIKRGIFRNLISESEGKYFDYKVLSVKKNNVDENYKINEKGGFFTIIIGKEDKIIPSGIYDYEIKYETSNQIIFGQDEDLIAWNVTGNGWNFVIENASAKIHLPDQARPRGYKVHVGSLYSYSKSYEIDFDGSFIVSTKELLNPAEGLTVFASFNKGLVKEISFIRKNIAGVVFVVLLLIYYLMVWIKVGLDPKKGLIIPLFEPPSSLSPATIGYIFYRGNKKKIHKCFCAALINLVLKKNIKINLGESSFLSKTPFSIRKISEEKESLSSEEVKIINKLKLNRDVESKDLDRFEEMLNNFRDDLKKRCEEKFFTNNSGFVILGCLAFFIFHILFVKHLSPYLENRFEFYFVIFFINILFKFLLPAPSVEGRKLIDQIEGFKIYLETAEKDLLEFSTASTDQKITLEVFEKNLPYAIALGIENKWVDKFVGSAKSLIDDKSSSFWTRGSSYQLFSGGDINNVVSSISGYSANIAKSSFGGSFSRGGGRGGGGGGGW